MAQQQVVHLPESALVGGGLGGLGGELGVGVDVGAGQVPPDVADVPVAGQQFAEDGLGLAAVGALEVAVLHEGDRCARGTADVVAVRVDGGGQIDDGAGGAERGADLRPGQEQARWPGRPAR